MKFGGYPFTIFRVLRTSRILHLSTMEKSTTSCRFYLQSFVKLGNHLKKCPKRDGRSYDHLLSKKTLDKRNRKTKAECPSCRKSFLRLDTHLRNSTACKHYISQKVIAASLPTTPAKLRTPLPYRTQTLPTLTSQTKKPLTSL